MTRVDAKSASFDALRIQQGFATGSMYVHRLKADIAEQGCQMVYLNAKKLGKFWRKGRDLQWKLLVYS
jgi:hypothetical protein